jgi:drug/metabolite transporter (DMT)-like permease
MSRLRADLVLLVVALIWGSAFAVQRIAGQYLDPFTFNGLRFILAGILLFPFTGILPREKNLYIQSCCSHKPARVYIILAGFFLFIAGGLQQAGLETTTAGNAGFITSLYVVIVPILLAVVWIKRLPWSNWIGACLAVGGSFLLSTGGEFRMRIGDLLELGGAFVWACHVILVGQAMRYVRVLPFSAGQYLVAGILNIFVSLVTRQPWYGVAYAWWTVVYIGILSTAIGYTLQVYGQKTAPASDAAILLSMEAVFAVITGWLLLDEKLAGLQIAGCVMIFIAIILVQLHTVAGRKEDIALKEK